MGWYSKLPILLLVYQAWLINDVTAVPIKKVVARRFVGQSLRPMLGVNYVPAPSDYDPSNQGVYWAGDTYNADFPGLWGPGGRDDVADIARTGSRYLRAFSFNQYFNHTPFLDRCQALKIRVIVPIKNYIVLGDPNPIQHLENMLKGIKNHPAVVAWGFTNELSFDAKCHPLTACASAIIAAARFILQQDTFNRPFIVAHAFGPNFPAVKDFRAIFFAAGLGPIFTSRFINGMNFYFNNDPPALQGVIIENVVKTYFADPLLRNTPMVVSEFGFPSAPAPAYTPSIQATAIYLAFAKIQQLAKSPKYPRFLGGLLYTYQDEYQAWSSNAQDTFGVTQAKQPLSYTIKKTTINKDYRVDVLIRKPSWLAFRCAILGKARKC